MRHPRAARAVAALICAAALLTGGCGGSDQGGASEGSDSVAPRGFFGIQPQQPLVPEDYARMAQGNVATVRLFIPWGLIDPTDAPDDYAFGPYDQQILDAAKEGIAVLPFLYGSPMWVSQGLDGNECETDCDRYAPRSDEALAEWGTFVGTVVDRYGPRGTFWAEHPEVAAQPIRTWQIWNEENSPTFYLPAPDPAGYAELLDVAKREISTRDPGGQVVLGGMFGTPLGGESPAIAAPAYLRELYAIEGSERDFDGVAAHPYAAHLEKVEEQVELLHDEIVRADDDASMWVTELGWSSAGPKDPLVRGLEGQAESLTDAYDYFLDQRDELGLEGVYWYSWHDTETQICDWCPHSGLFTEELEPKPAWEAFVSFTGGS